MGEQMTMNLQMISESKQEQDQVENCVTSYNDFIAIVTNIVWCCHKDRKTEQMSRAEVPVLDLSVYGNMIYYNASITDKLVQDAYSITLCILYEERYLYLTL